ncbi:ABC transporter permease [Tunturiibacter gelidoferens]|uniref:ABC transporter permease n=1 Tax=Tunturiibacter gelidiferens TaxID=3069689 RepID=A0AAU7YZV4_9BACT
MPILRVQQILQIAVRNFRRFRLQAVLIVVATMTGTAGVLVSAGYAAGGRQKILDQFASLGTNVIIVTPQQSRAVGGRARTGSLVTTLNPADYRAIKQSVDDISSASPTMAAVLRIRAGDLTKNTTVVGCTPEYFVIKHWLPVRGEVFEERANRQQARVALLGTTAAQDLFGEGDPTGSRIEINRIPFTIAGVMSERGQGLDASNEDDQVYVPLDTAMHRLLNVNYFNSILLQMDSRSQMDDATEQIRQLLGERHRHIAPAGDDFVVQNRKSLLDTQLSAFSRLTFLIRWIAGSGLVVSSLGVFAVTWIGIRNRTREVGTRRALGATRGDILLQFFSEGTLGALIGCGTGMGTGYLVLRSVDARLIQPLMFSTLAAGLEVFVSVAVYSTFTLISSLRAVRIELLVALHAE